MLGDRVPAVTGLCFLAFFFIPKGNYALQLTLNMFAQFCAGPTAAMTWVLYGDIADYGEWKFGRRSTGLIYSALLFSIKTGTLMLYPLNQKQVDVIDLELASRRGTA